MIGKKYNLLKKILPNDPGKNILNYIHFNHVKKTWYSTDGRILIGIKEESFQGPSGPYFGINMMNSVKREYQEFGMIFLNQLDFGRKFPDVNRIKFDEDEIPEKISLSLTDENDIHKVIALVHIKYQYLKILKSYDKYWKFDYHKDKNKIIYFENDNSKHDVFGFIMPFEIYR